MKVLLVEPPYRNKYPPLGLMKISSYHKNRGDFVCFVKGNDKELREKRWDIIYITTLFTFYWEKTIKTITFYQSNSLNKDIRVGGVLVTLMPREIEKETGIKPHIGLIPEVEGLMPDYEIVEGKYKVDNASFGYTTRGCTNNCGFCAVRTLEPDYEEYIPLKHQLNEKKKDLILLDNNVLASPQFNKIIEDIINSGFPKGAMYGKARRYVDFNQGLDARILTEEKMHLLSKIAIRPLRIAFDNIKHKDLYIEKTLLANKYGVRHLSNYILFNYKDTPEDFYQRLRINVELNAKYDMNIYSFPMKYVPLDALDRKHRSPNWTRQQLRGVQCILLATHGVVGPKIKFFEKAFGRNEDEFKHIIDQPEEHILYRDKMKPFTFKANKPLINKKSRQYEEVFA